jgi:hypothetical protein
LRTKLLSLDLEKCPFCGNDAVADEIKPTFDEKQFICGCDTVTCRGYVHHSPRYYDYKLMALRWNKRPDDGIKAPYVIKK